MRRFSLVCLLSIVSAAQQVSVSNLDNAVTGRQGVMATVESADHNYTYSISCIIQGKGKSIVQTIHSKDKLMFKPYQLPKLALLAQPTSSIVLEQFSEVWDKEKPMDIDVTLTPDFQTLTESRSGRMRTWLLKQLPTHSTLSVSLHRSGMAQEEVVEFNIQGIASELAKHEECR